MNPRESFTLCPAGAFLSSEDESLKETRVIPGTIRQEWWTDDNRRFEIVPEIGYGIRAAPFEPCVSDRNLPPSGIITPLSPQEYESWVQARHEGNNTTLAEHQFLVKDNDYVDWKWRYLQSEVSRRHAQAEVLYLLDERRRMKIEILRLQAQLHQMGSKQSSRGALISDFDVKETREDTKAPAAHNNTVDGDADDREEAPTHMQESGPTSRLQINGTETIDNDATFPVLSSKTECCGVEMEISATTKQVTTGKRARKKVAPEATMGKTDEEDNASTLHTRRNKRFRNKSE